MAENVQEVKPPEPPPKPVEVPKPTELSNRSEAEAHGQPNESQQSAHQDARNAVQSEHAKATSGRGPDVLTPQVEELPDEHAAPKNGPEGSAPQVQARLDAQTAAKAERNAATPQDSSPAEQAQEQSTAQRVPEQTDSWAARPDEPRVSAGAGDRNPPGSAGESNRPERDVSHAAMDDLPRPGDQGFDPGVHRGELRDGFRPGTHDPDGHFEEKERRIADRLAEDGASVHPRERDDTVEDKKNPDSMVRNSPDDPGTVTEFKTLDNASSNAVRRNILAAAKQVDQYGGGHAVLDGRGVNLTDEDARRGYARAAGQARQLDLTMPNRVEIIMGDGSIKVFPEE